MYVSDCYVYDKAEFAIETVLTKDGEALPVIRLHKNGETSVNLALSTAQLEILADKICEWLDRRQQAELAAAAAVTDAAFRRLAEVSA